MQIVSTLVGKWKYSGKMLMYDENRNQVITYFNLLFHIEVYRF